MMMTDVEDGVCWWQFWMLTELKIFVNSILNVYNIEYQHSKISPPPMMRPCITAKKLLQEYDMLRISFRFRKDSFWRFWFIWYEEPSLFNFTENMVGLDRPELVRIIFGLEKKIKKSFSYLNIHFLSTSVWILAVCLLVSSVVLSS